ncbi:MAG: AI-2E family transporter [Patescibacteria group bacterium]
MNNKRFQVFFFISALLASLVLTLLVFRPYLTLLAFGGVLAVIAMPLYRYLKKFLKSDIASAFLTVLFIAVVILFPLAFFLAALTGEAIDLFANANLHLTNVSGTEYLLKILPESLHAQIPQLIEQSFGMATKVAQFVSSNLIGIFSNAFSVVFGFFIVLFSVYYLLKDGHKIKNTLLSLSPLADEYDELVFEKIAIAIRAVMGGVLIMGILKGVLAGFFFWIFGVPAPLFWGVLTGIASFVPVFGVSLTTLPLAIYLFATGHIWSGVGLMAVSVAIIGTIDNFLQPKLVESKTKIHPLLILLAILGGLKFYGFAGFILGPLTLAVTLALFSIYEKEFKSYLEKGRDEESITESDHIQQS